MNNNGVYFVSAHILIGTFVSVTIEGTSNRLAQCIYSKDSKGLLTADCTNSNLRVIPENVQTDVEVCRKKKLLLKRQYINDKDLTGLQQINGFFNSNISIFPSSAVYLYLIFDLILHV